MAHSSRKLSRWLVLLPVLAASAIAIIGLFSHRREQFSLQLLQDPYLHNILNFSLTQAALSCLLSILLAIPVARALLFFPNMVGRRLFLSLSALAFVMPSFVLITGLIILLGAQGWFINILGDNWKLFGWNGILIAHVYLNMPLAIRVIYQALQSIPNENWRLSQQMRQSFWSRWIYLEWNAIKPHIGLLSAFIFVLCFNSFAVILALGGGPRATTIEVAIYQALKYDYNLSEALLLSLIQVFIAGAVLLWAGYIGKSDLFRIGKIQSITPLPLKLIHKTLHASSYLVAWIFLALPIAAVVTTAALASNKLEFMMLAQAAGRSVFIAGFAALIAISTGWSLLLPIRSNRASSPKLALFAEWLAVHHMVIPAMVIGVGWFAFFITRIDIEQYSLVFLIVLNALILVPFVVLQLKPLLVQWDHKNSRIMQNWRPTIWQRLFIEWRFIAPALRPTLALVMVLALGDVPIFALFGQPNHPTLTWLIYRLAGSYQLDQAALASMILLLFSTSLIFWMEPKHAKN